MALQLVDKVLEFLKARANQRFTAREIAIWILKTYPDECREKQKKSKATVVKLDSDDALIQQLVAEISSSYQRIGKKYPDIKWTESRPRKFYFSTISDTEEVSDAEEESVSEERFVTNVQQDPDLKQAKKADKLTEHDLYPMLVTFLRSELNVYSKRIDEKKSSNSRGAGGNKWLYPDLVGMEDLSEGWTKEIKDLTKEYFAKKTKLWSFEVKILLNISNVREAFFQTVSNSSWANFSYLVTSEIQGKGNTLKELRMLSSLHGIGIIQLDTDNPTESQITIPAIERKEIDWDAANRLAAESKDFLEYIKTIRHFYQTGDMRTKDWDQPRQSKFD